MSTAKRSSAWLTDLFYLDFEAACAAVAALREEAAIAGHPKQAPPRPLEDCERSTIEIALGAPFAGVYDREFYPDLSTKAAVLVFTLSKSQACEDGNKRIAALLLATFLRLNGHRLQTTNAAIEDTIRRAEDSAADQRENMLAEINEWLRDAIVPLDESAN